jgi:hypothetical protein
MNKNKLKQFVNALDELSDDVKDWDVEMESTKEPTCGTPGCHAGLISIVAKDLPELQEIHKIHLYLTNRVGCQSNYHYSIWADTLAEFLGIKNRTHLREWAKDNPKLWGNKFGEVMFMAAATFTDDTGNLPKQLTHRGIINHWKQVLKNIEA